MTTVYVYADARPVKEEVCRVAARYAIPVVLVANSRMRVPEGGGVRLQVVAGGQLDSADDWIAARAGAADIVVTADVPLASRCVAAGANASSHVGASIPRTRWGTRWRPANLMAQLREAGTISGGGPAPLAKRERSLFLQKLDELIQQIRRSR